MKLNAEAQERIIGALRVGADMGMAARAVGVTRKAVYKLIDRSPRFKERAQEARNYADEVIVKSLYNQAKAGNVKAIIFWLKNRKRDEWRDHHEFSGTIEHEVERVAQFADGSAYIAASAPVSDTRPN